MERKLEVITYLLIIFSLSAWSTAILVTSLPAPSFRPPPGDATVRPNVAAKQSPKDLVDEAQLTLNTRNRYMRAFKHHMNYRKLVESVAQAVQRRADSFSIWLQNLAINNNATETDYIQQNTLNSNNNSNNFRSQNSRIDTNELDYDFNGSLSSSSSSSASASTSTSTSTPSAILKAKQFDFASAGSLNLFEGLVETIN